MTPLKIEVTEAMLEKALHEWFGRIGEPLCIANYTVSKDTNTKGMPDRMQAALTAAFQHPEFVRQIREQVVACVPLDRDGCLTKYDWGHNDCAESTRASLGRLLGEEG